MARAKLIYNWKCPFCDETCSSSDEYTITKRKTKNYFHRACYMANTRKNKSKEL